MILSQSPELRTSLNLDQKHAEASVSPDLISALLGQSVGKTPFESAPQEKPNPSKLDDFRMAYLAALQQTPSLQIQPEAVTLEQIPAIQPQDLLQTSLRDSSSQGQNGVQEKAAQPYLLASSSLPLDLSQIVRPKPLESLVSPRSSSAETPESSLFALDQMEDLLELQTIQEQGAPVRSPLKPISGHEFLSLKNDVENKMRAPSVMSEQSATLNSALSAKNLEVLPSGAQVRENKISALQQKSSLPKLRGVELILDSSDANTSTPKSIHLNLNHPVQAMISREPLKPSDSKIEADFFEAPHRKEGDVQATVLSDYANAPVTSHDRFIQLKAPQSAQTAPVWQEAEVFQISQNLKTAAQQGSGEVRIRLRPEHLGELHIRLSAKNGGIDLKISASSEGARKALEKNLPALEKSLLEHQLKLEKVEIATASVFHGLTAGAEVSSPMDSTLDSSSNLLDSGSNFTGGFHRGSDSQDQSSRFLEEGGSRNAPAALARSWPSASPQRSANAAGRLDLWA